MRIAVLGAAIAIGATAAACSDTDSLEGGYYPTPVGSDQGGKVAGGGSTTPASGAGTTKTPLPVPTSGPGSASSPARQFFLDKVFPTLSVCVSCHATGNLGAPKFMAQDGPSAYQGIDTHAMIQPNSLFLSKGSHAGGSAPALDANQSGLVTQWLAMEAQERVGQAAPVNILEKIGDCLDETLFNAVQFNQLRTRPRDKENTDNCTGCNNAPCRTCHTGGDGNFYMAVGSALDTQTFVESKKAKYIVKYIGLNGTTPVASNAIKLKGEATVTDRPYSHPMYEVSTEMQGRIDAFVSAAITKYQNKQCGQ